MTHTLKLVSISPVTHDTHHLVLEKPEGFEFTPGQAVDLALDRDGWREEKRPFTFTSLPGDPNLEFVIKSYPDHDGVTEQIAKLEAGDTVIVDDPWGAIEDKGPGWFIAGGAGVTPFIAVLKKRLDETGSLDGCTLIFANKTEADIILRDTFDDMPGLKTVYLVEDQDSAGQGVKTGRIDADVLRAHVTAGQGKCYVCGPDPMIEAVTGDLETIGVPEGDIITEEFD